ncbi:MAG: hypothetical protein K0U78_06530, partial [Actinomycetia bacterium]|nr:hypothetical protein [Actinomycetes bacterium]
MLRSLFVAVLVLILLVVAAAAAILQGGVLQATFLANPYINGVIGVGLFVGVVFCFAAFWRAGLAATGMRRLAREEYALIAPRHILGPTASLLHSSRNNQVNLKLTPQEISALLDQIA